MSLGAEMQEILRTRCSSLGTSFVSQGGNRFIARPSNRMLFAKAGPVAQVMGEAMSLEAMHRASVAAGHRDDEVLIPAVHAFGYTDDKQKAFLVTDYKNLKGGLNRSSQRTLGKRLAEMHAHGTSPNGKYGFERPTHCGETEQDNTWTDSWSEFWAERRMGDLIRRSHDKELMALGEELKKKVYPLLFNDKAMRNVKPAIIHGDLWSGNSGTDESTGQPIIFDPSSSYSHNEAELGIMKMFGGYTSEFFDAYHQVIPKAEPYYDQRIDLYEAYHHLNHFVIFGGGYRTGTVQLLKKLIAWAEKESERARSGGKSDGGDDGDCGHARGLRGGNNGGDGRRQGSTMSHVSELSAHPFQRHFRPPSPDHGAAGPSTLRRDVGDDSDESFGGKCHSSAQPRADGEPHNAFNSTSMSMPTAAQIADFFSQMVCYIWFSIGSPSACCDISPCTPSRSPVMAHQPQQSSPLTPRRSAMHNSNYPNYQQRGNGERLKHIKSGSTGSSSANASTTVPFPANAQDTSKAMQNQLIQTSISSSASASVFNSITADPVMQRLQPKGRFLRFTRELLGTTQLSTSVITLALIYVHRLKALHPHLKGREGSEYRVGISALMLANKILDDNTYLNKTWAEVSGMPLAEISKMEVEFWLGLKMELHIGKADYDEGLEALQSMANERSRAIQEREAVLKRMVQQQHFQQQQNAMFARQALRSPSHSSLPFSHRQWTVSSDSLLPVQHSFHPYVMPSSRFEPRHSISGGVTGYPFANVHQQIVARNTSPDLVHPLSAMPETLISPSQAFSHILPSSPLSHTSAVPSLAATSNDALVYPSDAEVSTPQDGGPVLPLYGVDEMLHSFHPTAASMYNINGHGTRDRSMDTSPSRQSQHRGNPTMQQNVSSLTQDHLRHTPASLPHQPSTLTGLKRDFERAKLGSASPSEGQMPKRFAYEHYDQGSRQRHSRLSSSGYQSPSESIAARHGSSSRPSSSASPYANRGLYDSQRISISPSHLSSSASTNAASPQNFSSVSRMPASSHEEQMYAQQMPKHAVNMRSTPNYALPLQNSHSVFSSALTPTALAAPLDFAHGLWPAQRAKAPLQYYSLASGEAYGTLGTYVPPSTTLGGSANHQVTPLRDFDEQVGRPTNAMTPNAARPVAGLADQHASFGVEVQSFGNDDAYQAALHGSSTSGSSLHLKRLPAPRLQQSDLSGLPHRDTGVQSATAGNMLSPFDHLYHFPDLDFHQQQPLKQQQVQHPAPPFYLDPHGWPLSTVPATSTFLFPYHLMPQHTSTTTTTTTTTTHPY